MPAQQMRQSSKSSKAKVLGHQTNHVAYNGQQQLPYEMWNSNAQNWYYYNGMPNVNSLAQHQAYVSGPGSSMQTTFPTYMPQYYTQQPPRSEVRNMHQAQVQGQVQGQRQGQWQGQVQVPSQPSMYYQSQQPQQNYNYWYVMQQQPTANTYSMAQIKPENMTRNKPQTQFYQNPTKPTEIQIGAAQTLNASSHSSYPLQATMSTRNQGHSYAPNLSNGGGSLNRIDSVSSFKNLQGSRIRNSQQDLVEYRRIVARTQHEKERKESEKHEKPTKKEQKVVDERNNKSKKPVKASKSNVTIKEPESIKKLTKQSQQLKSDKITESDQNKQVEVQANKRRTKVRKTINQNVVIEESLSSRGSSFFHKLGLFKGSKRHSFFSMLRKHSKTQNTEPSCSNQSNAQNPETRPKSVKKIKFLKRFFNDDPTT